MTTTIVNVRYDEYDEYVGRAVPRKGLPASPYANPFRVGRNGDHETVTRRFLAWVLYSDDSRARWIFTHVHELRGKRIGCWCAPPGGVTTANKPWRCHAQVLAAMADGERDAVLAALADGAKASDDGDGTVSLDGDANRAVAEQIADALRFASTADRADAGEGEG